VFTNRIFIGAMATEQASAAGPIRTATRGGTLEATRQRVYGWALCCALSFFVTSCDPCGTTLGCAQSPRLAVVGQIVDENTGVPAGGVQVEMRQQSGTALVGPTAITTTRSDGVFELELAATDLTYTHVSFTITAPGKAPYSVPDVRTRGTLKTGEATVLPPWVSAHPTFPYVLVFFKSVITEEPVPNTDIEFRRTGGVGLLQGDAEVTSAQGATDGAGWVYLFSGLNADRTGNLVGDLIVRLPSGPVVIPAASFPAVARFRPQTTIVVLIVGPG
jgi:hypothetical protein